MDVYISVIMMKEKEGISQIIHAMFQELPQVVNTLSFWETIGRIVLAG